MSQAKLSIQAELWLLLLLVCVEYTHTFYNGGLRVGGRTDVSIVLAVVMVIVVVVVVFAGIVVVKPWKSMLARFSAK